MAARRSKGAGRTGKPFHVADVPSDLAAKDPYINAMVGALKRRDLVEGSDSKIALVLEEAVTNGIRHGNGHDPKKKVHVELHRTKRGWAMLMADEGDGFDPATVPDPTTPEGLLAEGGRGLLIIRSFMNKLEFREGGCVMWAERHVAATKAGPKAKKTGRKPRKKPETKPKPASRKKTPKKSSAGKSAKKKPKTKTAKKPAGKKSKPGKKGRTR